MAGVDDLDKQRPLKLQEALKKITLNIRKDRMSAAWTALGVCSDDQYAFLRGKSTMQAAVIKRLLLERAQHYGVPLCVVDGDLHKAYDGKVGQGLKRTLPSSPCPARAPCMCYAAIPHRVSINA